MTKEEILAMEAGNQLNAEVASQVMGIRVEYPFGERFPYYLKEDDRWREDVPWAEQGKMKWAPILSYSTDISAAWQVVEKMITEGFMFYLQGWDTKLRGLRGWECNIFKTVPANYPVRNVSTAPEAICKAALLATLEK